MGCCPAPPWLAWTGNCEVVGGGAGGSVPQTPSGAGHHMGTSAPSPGWGARGLGVRPRPRREGRLGAVGDLSPSCRAGSAAWVGGASGRQGGWLRAVGGPSPLPCGETGGPHGMLPGPGLGSPWDAARAGAGVPMGCCPAPPWLAWTGNCEVVGGGAGGSVPQTPSAPGSIWGPQPLSSAGSSGLACGVSRPGRRPRALRASAPLRCRVAAWGAAHGPAGMAAGCGGPRRRCGARRRAWLRGCPKGGWWAARCGGEGSINSTARRKRPPESTVESRFTD